MIEDNNALQQVKILVAEDNPTNLEVCLHFLKSLGVSKVTAVTNGLEVLETIAANPGFFDLVLMDVRMPEMNGLEATKEIIRRWPSPKNRPRVVALTAHAFEEESEKCFEAEMDGYLTKPIQKESLLEALQLHALVAPETAGDDNEGKLVDFKQFDMVVDGPESPCVGIYQSFVEGVKPMLEQIRSAANSMDSQTANDLSHQLKGSSSSFGFVSFSEGMKAAEVLAKDSGNVAALDSKWLQEIGELFERSVNVIQSKRGY